MFINISNHPSSSWEDNQLRVANMSGPICDISFPDIPPDWDVKKVSHLVDVYWKKVKEVLPEPDGVSVIHVMGESVFTFMLVSLLLSEKYIVVASTTERVVFYEGDKKISSFKFVRFRSYN